MWQQMNEGAFWPLVDDNPQRTLSSELVFVSSGEVKMFT